MLLKSIVLVIFLAIIGHQQTVAVDVKTEERNLRISKEGFTDKKGPQKKSTVSFLSQEKLTPGRLKSDVVIPYLSQISRPQNHTTKRSHVLEQPKGLGDDAEFCEGGDCTGYLLEFTRTNTDCSGRVEGIGGLLSGHPTFMNAFGDIETNMIIAGAGTLGYGYYVLRSYDLDFLDDWDTEFEQSKPRCTNQPDGYCDGDCQAPYGGFIPYSTELQDHGGYFYGHKFVSGSFPAVLRQIGGAFYDLYFDTWDHCITGERPSAFFAHLKKGECYFDPTHFGITGIDEHTGQPYKVHSWFKVVGFNAKEETMIFTVHNNNDCDQFSFGLSKKRTVSNLKISPRIIGISADPVDGMEPVYGECQPFARGPGGLRRLSNSNLNTLAEGDGPLGRLWVKRTAA